IRPVPQDDLVLGPKPRPVGLAKPLRVGGIPGHCGDALRLQPEEPAERVRAGPRIEHGAPGTPALELLDVAEEGVAHELSSALLVRITRSSSLARGTRRGR